MDEGSPVDIIYLDVQNKVPHQRYILNLKPHDIGISVINSAMDYWQETKGGSGCRRFKVEISFEWSTKMIP